MSLLTSSCCHSYFLPPPLSYFSLTSQTPGLHFPCMTAGWKIPAWLTDPAWPTCIVPCSPQTTYFPGSPSELLLGSASKTARTTLTRTKSSWQGPSSPAPPEHLSPFPQLSWPSLRLLPVNLPPPHFWSIPISSSTWHSGCLAVFWKTECTLSFNLAEPTSPQNSEKGLFPEAGIQILVFLDSHTTVPYRLCLGEMNMEIMGFPFWKHYLFLLLTLCLLWQLSTPIRELGLG